MNLDIDDILRDRRIRERDATGGPLEKTAEEIAREAERKRQDEAVGEAIRFHK